MSTLQCYECSAYMPSDECEVVGRIKRLCPQGFDYCSNGTVHVYFHGLFRNLTAHWQGCSTKRQCTKKICPDFWGILGRVSSCTMDCCDSDFCPGGERNVTDILVRNIASAAAVPTSARVVVACSLLAAIADFTTLITSSLSS